MNDMIKSVFFFLLLFAAAGSHAQPKSDSLYLISFNQQIDDDVVKQDTSRLKTSYAEDFVFSHGSGRVEGKAGWLRSVAKGNFLLRQHDSVTVEMHPDLAILKGKLSVQKKNKEKVDRYHLKYIRVYVYRKKQWLLVSHSTTFEVHE
jgi:ketosteroid isomerase-like protein